MTLRVQTLNNSYTVAAWTSLAQASQGDAFQSGVLSDKTVQVAGTFATATVNIEGSMDGTNWVILNDPQGNPLTFTGPALKLIQENPQFLRPAVAGGGGTTAINVFIGARAVA